MEERLSLERCGRLEGWHDREGVCWLAGCVLVTQASVTWEEGTPTSSL